MKEEFWKESDFETSFYNASDFESRFSKNVRFSVNLKQIVLLESEFLQHVKFWNIFFTTRQILVRIFNNATDFYVILVLKIEIFLDNSLLKNLSNYVLIQANLKQLVSFWIRILQRVSFRIKLLSSYRFLLWLSALRQNLSQDVYNASVSDEKNVVRKSSFYGKLALKEQFSWSIYTVKSSMLAFLWILEDLLRKNLFSFKKKKLDQNFWKKNLFSNHFLYNASCFESRFSNESDLEPFFYNSTISNRKFYNLSDF